MKSERQAPVGATQRLLSRRDRLRAWARHHRHLFGSTLSALLRDWVGLMTTWLVIGIALSLPVLMLIGLRQIGETDHRQVIEPAISVYLSSPSGSAVTQGLVSSLRQMPEIRKVTLISEAEALAEFSKRSGFSDVLNAFSENPLPAVLEVRSVSTEGAAIKLLTQKMDGLEGIDSISFDAAWRQRLSSVLLIIERSTFALGVLFLCGVVLIIGNTLRLTIENRRHEIEVIKLVGGTDAFVQRPFVYRGFWLGIGGAVMAWIMIQSSLIYLSVPVETLARSYRSDFALEALGFRESLALLALGAGLGIVGSMVSVRRHLGKIQPN